MKHLNQLAQFLKKNKVWPEASAKTLLQLLQKELGNPHALTKGFSVNNKVKLRAQPPENVLLICAGNLPIAAWQALSRLALLRVSTVFLKLPTSPHRKTIQLAAQQFYQNKFFKKIRFISSVPDDLIQKMDAVIVYGTDETIEKFRTRAPWQKRFLGYGHKLSCGIIFPQDINVQTAQKVVIDFLTYQQEGCLSPHLFYVLGNPETFARFVSNKIKSYFQRHPFPKLSPSQKALIYSTRQEALLKKNKILTPTQNLNTTLIIDSDPTFKVSCLNQVLYFKRAKNIHHVSKLLRPVSAFLSTISMSRVKPFKCGATRFCSIGKMQNPSLFWKQDGLGILSELVRWETIE